MITLLGVSNGTAAEIRDRLGPDVTAELLRDWKRRGLVAAHRIGRANCYPFGEVIEAEATTRDRTKRRRAACHDPRRTAHFERISRLCRRH